MVLKYLHAVTFLSLLIAFSACGDMVQQQDDEQVELTEITSAGVTFSVQEVYEAPPVLNSPVKPFIQLQLQTNAGYHCWGYAIATDYTKQDQALTISAQGVKEPEGLCPATIGPAIAKIPLYLQLGNYDLVFKYDGKTYGYDLKVTESSLQVSGGENPFWTPSVNTFLRYPENSFTILCQSVPEKEHICTQFSAMLKESLAINSFSFPREGKIPYPVAGETFKPVEYYTYQDKYTFLKAGEMLESYADSTIRDGEDVFLSIISWKDQGFRSWTDIGE
jgi:hypothetical protein